MSVASFILASASPRRVDLLRLLGLTPVEILPADIDETPCKNELPKDYALRVASEKAQAVAALRPGSRILSADTVVAMGRRVLPKAEDEATARDCLKRLSGRRHQVLTAVAFIDAQGKLHTRLSESRVAFKRLTAQETESYIASGEWNGKAGGYAIQGLAGGFIPWISGSHSAIVGLPMAETLALLSR